MSDSNEQPQPTPFERALERFQAEQKRNAQERQQLGGPVDHQESFKVAMWRAGRSDLPPNFNPFVYFGG